MHSYYHLIPLVLSYCYVCYLSDSVGHCRYLYLEWVTDVGVFPRMSSADEETLGYTRGRGVQLYYFSEAPRLARKCGTHRSDRHVRAL
jgi:hypothetical protein